MKRKLALSLGVAMMGMFAIAANGHEVLSASADFISDADQTIRERPAGGIGDLPARGETDSDAFGSNGFFRDGLYRDLPLPLPDCLWD